RYESGADLDRRGYQRTAEGGAVMVLVGRNQFAGANRMSIREKIDSGGLSAQVQHLLLVEDDDRDVVNLETQAKGDEHTIVHRARSIGEAHRLLGNMRFDGILLDLTLDDSAGFFGVAELRRMTDAPIIVWAELDDRQMLEATTAGADNWIE